MSLSTWKESAPHEFDVHFHTVPARDEETGLGPYYALDSIYKRHDWRNQGKPTATTTFDGDEWAICMDYSEGGLDPWAENPDFELETVREFRIYFVAMDETYYGERADRSQRVRGGHIHVRPRWPDMTSDGKPVSVPDLDEPSGWVDVHVQGSNIDFEKYDDLAREVLGAFDFNSVRYLRDERINPTSTINDAAVYVRLRRSESGPVHAADGPLARMNGLLRTDRSGYRAFKEDNRKLPGYNVSATIDSERAADLLSGHRLGKECKHYYIRDPEAYEPGEFGYHPKLEVAYQTNATPETVRWSEAEEVERELHETLMNLLEWADLPTRGDPGKHGGVFFEDEYFDPTAEVERNLRVADCPLPEIENEQDRAVQRVWGKMLDSDRAIFETLVSDGGEMSPQDAADEAGVSYRTVRRFADRCEEVVEHAYGKLEFTSLYARDEVLERLRSAREEFEEAVESAVAGAAEAADDRERSRWSTWKQRYNAQVREDADGCRAEVRVRYDPDDRADLQKVLTRAKRAYRDTFDRTMRGVRVVVDGRTIDDIRSFLSGATVQGHRAFEKQNFSEEVERQKESVDWEAWARRMRRSAAPE